MRLIDADRLKEAITTDYYEHFTKYHDSDQIALIEMVEYDIEESKTIDPESLRLHGEWIPCKAYPKNPLYKECSCCGSKKNIFNITRFCQHCGAKMK